MGIPARNTEIVLCACIVTWFSALSWTENQNERWYLASEGINKKLLRNSQIMSLPILHEEHSCLPYTAWLSPMLLSLLALNPLQWIYLLCATVTSLTCFELHSGCTILGFRSLKFAFFFLYLEPPALLLLLFLYFHSHIPLPILPVMSQKTTSSSFHIRDIFVLKLFFIFLIFTWIKLYLQREYILPSALPKAKSLHINTLTFSLPQRAVNDRYYWFI